MRKIVTTCPKYQHLLPEFTKLWNRFCGIPFEIDIALEHERKSDQLLRVLRGIEESHCILLEEDFFLLGPCDYERLERAKIFSIENRVDRFSLQSGLRPHYRHDFAPYQEDIVRATDGNICIMSLEASIWRRDFLLGILEPGWTDQKIEIICSDKIRGSAYKVFGFTSPVLTYKDAVIGGEKRIDIREDGVYLLTQSGWEKQCGLE